MTSKRVLAGLAALGGLGLLGVIAAALSWWWLVVATLAGMLAVIGVVVLNTNLLLRAHRKAFDRAGRSFGPGVAPAASPAAGNQADVTGAVRLLAAQYVGRLDRAQSALERAAARLEGATSNPAAPSGDSVFAQLPHGSTVLLHHLDDAALTQARAALAAGHQVHAVVIDSADRERLEKAGLGDSVTLVEDASDAGHPVTIVLPGT